LKRRSATPRSARPCVWPAARRRAYCCRLRESCCTLVRAPVIQRIAKSCVAAVSHTDLSALSALPCHRSDTAVGSKCTVIPLTKWTGRFCQKSSGNDPSDTWERLQYRYVAEDLSVRCIAGSFGDFVHQFLHPIAHLLPHHRE